MSGPTPHRARKRFGQNFLQDRNVIDRIIRAIKPESGQNIVEIGPGLGALTGRLLEEAGRLQVIELDRDLAASLRERYADESRFRLFEGDVLRFDFAGLDLQPGPLRIIGNLPYNISTPLLFHLLDYRKLVSDMVFMLQLEVVNRMAAGTGEKNYGRLGLMVQYHCKVERLFNVPASAFRPAPKVESAIVRLVPHRELPFPALDHDMLARVVSTAFNQRRKTLRNSLKTLVSADDLNRLDIDPGLRPENISLQEYVRISDKLTRA